jgi:hypothetical protein
MGRPVSRPAIIGMVFFGESTNAGRVLVGADLDRGGGVKPFSGPTG